MAWKLKHKVRTKGRWREATYREVVLVIDGICTVQKAATSNQLQKMGYVLIGEESTPKTPKEKVEEPKVDEPKAEEPKADAPKADESDSKEAETPKPKKSKNKSKKSR